MADAAATSRSTNTANSNQQQKNEPKLENHKYRYKVSTFEIETKDPAFADQNYRITLAPICIKTISLLSNFDQFLQPVMEVTAVLPPPVVDYIRVHKDEISFIIRIDMVDFLSGANMHSGGSDKDYADNGVEELCKDKFIFVTPDTMKTPNLGEYIDVSDVLASNEKASEIKGIIKAGHNSANYTQEQHLFLWKEHDLYTVRKQVNAVYSSATIANAASSILSDNGFNHVLLAPPTNNETFGQLLIPPMTMMNVFRFMQSQYGMYSTDVIFFNDIWRTYVIDKSGECKAHEENEFTKNIISVVPSRSEHSQSTGTSMLTEKKEFHTKVDVKACAVRSLSSINDVLQGNTNMYIDSRNNEVTTVSGAGEQRGEGCVNVTTDREGSPYTKSRQANAVSELALNMRIDGLNDYNYTAFSPNKAFIISFKDKDFYQYNGYYRLMNATHIITREGQGDQMRITGLFEFTRKKALSEEERKTIDYDVFRTAQVTEEGKEEAKKNGEENKVNDPSYKQSQENKVAEGKVEAPKEEVKGSPAPSTTSDVSKKPEGVPALTHKELEHLDKLAEQPSKIQEFNPDTNKAYQEQEAKRAANKKKEPSNKGGSKPPTPLDEKK